MGMDVHGENPKIKEGSVKPEVIDFSKADDNERDVYFSAVREYEKDNPGVYFRANVWSWRPIHELICRFCDEYFTETGKILIEEPVLVSMSCNDGAGPKTDEVCQELVRRFNNWLEHNAQGASLDIGCMHVLKGTGKFANDEEMADPSIATESAYSADDEHIKEFVAFLENCGGFQVW